MAVLAASDKPREKLPGFDYELMAKITAKNNAKRARYGNHSYDPETWLPVPEKKPEHPRPPRRDASSVRAARIHRAALRRQQQQSGGYDPLWWIHAPAMPNPRCPWSYVVLPALAY